MYYTITAQNELDMETVDVTNVATIPIPPEMPIVIDEHAVEDILGVSAAGLQSQHFISVSLLSLSLYYYKYSVSVSTLYKSHEIVSSNFTILILMKLIINWSQTEIKCLRNITISLLTSNNKYMQCIPKSHNCYQTPGLVRNNSLPAQVILCRPRFSPHRREK